MSDVTKRELVGMVLAAGAGNRLRPLTDLRPKPLCPVANRPLLNWALDRVRPHVSRTAVNAHHLAGQIDAHLRGSGVKVSHEPALLGSAGALGHLSGWIGEADVLLHNADSWLTDDLSELMAGWSGEFPRLLVTEAGDEPADFGDWRYVGVSLLPHRFVEGRIGSLGCTPWCGDRPTNAANSSMSAFAATSSIAGRRPTTCGRTWWPTAAAVWWATGPWSKAF